MAKRKKRVNKKPAPLRSSRVVRHGISGMWMDEMQSFPVPEGWKAASEAMNSMLAYKCPYAPPPEPEPADAWKYYADQNMRAVMEKQQAKVDALKALMRSALGMASPIELMKGSTCIRIEGLVEGSNRAIFTMANGMIFKMYHSRSCCEHVDIEDVCGSVDDLLHSPLTMAEEVMGQEWPLCDAESYTWTFYKLATVKGYVTVRWLGTSNGYYSERVDIDYDINPANL